MFSKPPQPKHEAEAVDNPYGHLSVTIIAHTSERGRCVADLLPTLPKGVEICIVFNEQGEEESFELLKDETLADGTTLKFAEWRWKEFRFDHARNLALGLAARPWVLWIDADELLTPAQFHVLRNLVDIPPGVGGLYCTVCGMQPSMYSGDEDKHFAVPQPRLIRNGLGFVFEGRCHEQVAWSILGQGYRIDSTPIVITHVGYVTDKATIQRKLERNVSLLIEQCADWDSKEWFFRKLLYRDLQSLFSLTEK